MPVFSDPMQRRKIRLLRRSKWQEGLMFRLSPGFQWLLRSLVCTLGFGAYAALAQQSLPEGPKPKEQSQQSIPDAPQPKTGQANQFPDNAPPAPKNTHGDEPAAVATPTPMPAARQQRGQSDMVTDVGKFGTISVTVNFVQVPVTVRDNSGKMVSGLSSTDFKIYEDGVLQQLKVFITDPF